MKLKGKNDLKIKTNKYCDSNIKSDRLFKMAKVSLLGFIVSGLVAVGCGFEYAGNLVDYNKVHDRYFDDMLYGNISCEEYDEKINPVLKTSDDLKKAIYTGLALSELCLISFGGSLIASETVGDSKRNRKERNEKFKKNSNSKNDRNERK